MKKLNLKKVLFLGVLALSIIGCQNIIEPEEFDNEQNKDLPVEPSYGDSIITVSTIDQFRKAIIRSNKKYILKS